MEKRALCFRSAIYGGQYAKRDKVRYEVNTSVWQDGKLASHPYYVVRRGEENTDWIDTEYVRRFKEVEDAKQFCQDMYEGKVDLAALKAEVDAERENRLEAKKRSISDEADTFASLLEDKGISLEDFLPLAISYMKLDHEVKTCLHLNASK